MKILIVSKLYPPIVRGGYELQCAATARALSTRHHVRVLTTDFCAEQAPPQPDVCRWLPATPTYGTGLQRSLRSTLDAWRRVRRELRMFAPDLIYLFQGSGMPHAVTAMLLATDLPVVLNVEDYWLADLYETDPFMSTLLAEPLTPRGVLVRAVDRVTTRVRGRPLRDVGVVWVSRYFAEHCVLPPGIRAARESVIRLTTPTAQALRGLYRDERPAIDPRAPRILFCGRVVPEKGIHLLVEALGALGVTYPGLTLRVAGAGEADIDVELRELAAHVGLDPAVVQILGMLDATALRAEFAQADMFVMPSIWDEPGGMALMDAAWAGVPVVASAAGGMPEILHPGEHAAFFAPGDREGLEQAIRETIEKPVQTERRRRLARAFIEAEGERYLERATSFVEDCAAA